MGFEIRYVFHSFLKSSNTVTASRYFREFELTISRNQSGSHKESACDVLSEAILKLYQETNYQIQPNSYDGLLKLYQRYNKT